MATIHEAQHPPDELMFQTGFDFDNETGIVYFPKPDCHLLRATAAIPNLLNRDIALDITERKPNSDILVLHQPTSTYMVTSLNHPEPQPINYEDALTLSGRPSRRFAATILITNFQTHPDQLTPTIEHLSTHLPKTGCCFVIEELPPDTKLRGLKGPRKQALATAPNLTTSTASIIIDHTQFPDLIIWESRTTKPAQRDLLAHPKLGFWYQDKDNGELCWYRQTTHQLLHKIETMFRGQGFVKVDATELENWLRRRQVGFKPWEVYDKIRLGHGITAHKECSCKLTITINGLHCPEAYCEHCQPSFSPAPPVNYLGRYKPDDPLPETEETLNLTNGHGTTIFEATTNGRLSDDQVIQTIGFPLETHTARFVNYDRQGSLVFSIDVLDPTGGETSNFTHHIHPDHPQYHTLKAHADSFLAT